MIEQIKQALERAVVTGEYVVLSDGVEVECMALSKDDTPNTYKWLRYLFGEVERLKKSNSNLLKQYHQRGKENDKVIYDLVSVNTELQKALEKAKEFLDDLYSVIGQDMDINPSAKKVYLSKIAYANNTFISTALERTKP